MKKIICLLVLFVIISCQNGLPPENGEIYLMDITSDIIGGRLELHASFELPDNRIDNFYDTLKVIFENSSNFGDINYSLNIFFETKSSNRLFLVSRNGDYLNVIENENFDASITDSKNKDYYMMNVLLDSYVDTIEEREKRQLHLRELKTENNKQTIAVMVEQKNSSDTYEYLTDFVLEGVYMYGSLYIKQSLPNFLK